MLKGVVHKVYCNASKRWMTIFYRDDLDGLGIHEIMLELEKQKNRKTEIPKRRIVT